MEMKISNEQQNVILTSSKVRGFVDKNILSTV